LNREIVEKTVKLDYRKMQSKIIQFINKQVRLSGLEGCIVGVSGGLDSSVVAALAHKALGESLLALVMPDSTVTPKQDISDAEELIRTFSIKHLFIDISPVVSEFKKNLSDDTKAVGNLRARIRMCLLYYYANINKLLVLGTGDKSELMIGYFTKYGDGGCDIMPISHLYKIQVRALAKYLNLPIRIIQKPSSPALWEGHTAEKEIGVTYEEIDSILYCLLDLKLPASKIIKKTGIEKSKIQRVLDLHERNEHKQKLPINIQ